MAIQIQLRRDTAANWTSSNPTLAQGEIGIETDTNTFKIGDGSTAWSGLSYFGGAAWGSITGTLSSQTDLQTALDAKLAISNNETALIDGASIAITGFRNTLATSSATRTFTISWTGDFFCLTVTLNATSSVFTFPANSLCTNSDGSASGDNTMSLSGVSGDVYEIAGKKRGATYSLVVKNFGQ